MLQSRLPLSDEELQVTLRRAQEIARGEAAAGTDGDLALYLSAAEELGIPREALAQALRERKLLAPQFGVAEQVFAPGPDGFWYVATVLEMTGTTAKVRFAAGGERSCPAGELQPLDLAPGRKLQADWPMGQGWWTSTVSRVLPEKGKVTVVWLGWPTTVPLSKLRLTRAMVAPKASGSAASVGLGPAVLRIGLAGFVLGALAMWLLAHLVPFLR